MLALKEPDSTLECPFRIRLFSVCVNRLSQQGPVFGYVGRQAPLSTFGVGATASRLQRLARDLWKNYALR